MMMRRLVLCLHFCLLFSFCAIVSCAVKTKPVYTRDGKQYGTTRGYVWRPTWWNHYERGSSFAEGQYWQDAIQDLEEAIRLRNADQRRARTYGMHFTDYFPHRELGIIYYRQGEFCDAIAELELSLATVESAKAEYFLNKARRDWLKETGADRTPPVIEISWPPKGLQTRELSLRVEGTVRDDQYAFSIAVNGTPIPVFLAKKEISFSTELPLNPGMNRIMLTARDLVGRETATEVIVHVDRAGPVLFLEPLRTTALPGGHGIILTGEARDGLGLSRVTVNGVTAGELKGKSHRFDQVLVIPPGQESVEIVAEDLVGNVTRGRLPVSGAAPPQIASWQQLAWLDSSVTDVRPLPFGSRKHSPPDFSAAAAKGGPPESRHSIDHNPGTASHDGYSRVALAAPAELKIRLKDLRDSLTVYYENLYIEGSATGPSAIQSLGIDGEQLLDRKGRNIFFSYLVGLKEGKNAIQIEAIDSQGRQAQTALTVHRKTPKIYSLTQRMRLSLIPFSAEACSLASAELATEDLLMSLIRQERFHMVERTRLDDVLGELKLSSAQLADEKTAVRVGRILAAEGSLTGGVFETNEAIEVVARLVDTETSEVLVTKDVFSEDKSLESISAMMDGLAYKLRQGLPLLEGAILRCEKNSFYLNIGKEHGALPEQKVLFFRQGPEIRHPVTQMYLGREWELVAEGRIKEVYEDASVASPAKKAAAKDIQPTDRVVTK